MINRQPTVAHPSPQRHRAPAHLRPRFSSGRLRTQRAFRSRPLEPSRERLADGPCERRATPFARRPARSTPSTCSSTCSISWARSSWARASLASRYMYADLTDSIAPLDSCECPDRRDTRWQTDGYRDRHRGLGQPRALPAERWRSPPHSLHHRTQAVGDQQADRQFGRRLYVQADADSREPDDIRRDVAPKRGDAANGAIRAGLTCCCGTGNPKQNGDGADRTDTGSCVHDLLREHAGRAARRRQMTPW